MNGSDNESIGLMIAARVNHTWVKSKWQWKRLKIMLKYVRNYEKWMKLFEIIWEGKR